MAGVRKKALPSGNFQGWYIDYTGKRRFFVYSGSRRKTQQIAERLEDDHRQIRLGYRPVPETDKTHDFRDIRETMDEYLAWGEAQGGRNGRPWGKTHLRNRRSQLQWWHTGLNVQTVADLHGMLPQVEAALRVLQKGRAPKTVASYAETIAAFCDWCVERGYLKEDPLKKLRQLDTTPQTHRRAMNVGEITRLLDVCAPHTRLMLETAFLTGLRANELRNLTVAHLDVKRGGLILDAVWTKNRKPGFQPLPVSLMEHLCEFAGQAISFYKKMYGRNLRKSSIPENPLLYVPSHPARSLDYHLEEAGIAKVTPVGKLDFHAVRLAYINLVIESGVTVKEAQTLARHATPQMTMNIYGRVREERLWGVVEQVAQTLMCARSVHEGIPERKDKSNKDLKLKEIEERPPFDDGGFDSRRLHFHRRTQSEHKHYTTPSKINT